MPVARKSELTFRDWVECTLDGPSVVVYVILGLFVGVVTAGFANINYGDDHDAWKNQVRVIRMFDDPSGTPNQQATARQQLARSVLDIQQHHGRIPGTESKQFESQIKHVARTGDRLHITLDEPSQWRNARFPLFIWAIIWLVIGSVTLGLSYAKDCEIEERNMAILPWRRAWPWIVMLLCICNPPFIGVMVLHYRILREHKAKVAQSGY